MEAKLNPGCLLVAVFLMQGVEVAQIGIAPENTPADIIHGRQAQPTLPSTKGAAASRFILSVSAVAPAADTPAFIGV